jgi:2'-hydroxyisoflavone reductase
MRLLFLGGTKFLGRHLVEGALRRGHDVTTFTRGQTNPGLFPEAEEIHGDRTRDLAPLRGREWDAVIDTSAYVPRVARAAAEMLAGAVEHYTFVSTISVYGDLSGHVSEDSPLAELDDPASEDVEADYGGLKVLCEQAVTEAFGAERTLLVRPGLIVGPHDPSGRFTYWPERIAEGGEVLAPGDPERLVQVIDARDLAAWMLDMAERRASGAFNATSPRLPMRAVLEACGPAEITWVDERFLLERGVQEWTELPLWIADPDFRGMLDADVSRALAAGLTSRPLEETARDTVRAAVAGGMTRARERTLLAEWHSASS